LEFGEMMGFLSKLFGSKERPLPEVIQKMELLTHLAAGALVFMLMEDVGVDTTKDQTERERLGNRAEYQARLLMSEPLNKFEYRNLASEAEALNAAVFMEKYPLMMELVVQTLRVRNTIYFARYGEPSEPLIGVEVLEGYGGRVGQEPDPDNYAALVQKVIDSMSDIGKARMHEHFLKGIHDQNS
jgi:hypothetical protein